MTMVEAEATALEIANKVEDAITGLPIGAPPTARIALIEARAALLRAADALADGTEARRD
jgi:hypothetical protein